MSHVSNLEKFCTKVAARTLDTQVDKLTEGNAKNLGFDFDAILAFIEKLAPMIMEIFGNCPAKATFAESVKNPTWGQRVAFRWTVRKHADSDDNSILKRRSAKAADCCLVEAALLTTEEIQKIVEEISDLDNLLI